MATPRRRHDFTLGGEAAEADPLLDNAFLRSRDFEAIEDKKDHRRFIVGRTGAGKSAALQTLERLHPGHVIRINPENLSLPYITNLQAIKYLDSLEVNLDTFWNALWRHILIVEIIKHRYKVDSSTAKENFFQQIRARIQTDRTKQQALDYLDEFEGHFWCETDERVREITDKFAQRLDAEGGISAKSYGLGVSASASGSTATETETRTQEVERFQRVVNENQLARLNKMIDVLDDEILARPHDYRYVVIDDLDRDWVDERIANDLIRCLFTTVYSLQHVRHLKVLVALRTNIFQELDFGRRGGGQEEKLRALVLDMRWHRVDLENLLDERVRSASQEGGSPIPNLAAMLPNSNRTMGRPMDYLLDRTLLRPRDAIAFANECLLVGAGKRRLAWSDIKTAELSYSGKRLLALRDEWKATYPGIDQVFERLRRSPTRIPKSELTERLDEVFILLTEPRLPGVRWLTDVSAPMWTSGPESNWSSLYGPIVQLLFGIGLLGISRPGSAVPVFFEDDPNFAIRESNLEAAESFYIHRTYQTGLDVRMSNN